LYFLQTQSQNFTDKGCILRRHQDEIFTTVQIDFSFLQCPYRLLGPPNLLFKGIEFLYSWGIKLATQLHLGPRLSVSGALPLLSLYAFMARTGTTTFDSQFMLFCQWPVVQLDALHTKGWKS
jgi:hypothetical protein